MAHNGGMPEAHLQVNPKRQCRMPALLRCYSASKASNLITRQRRSRCVVGGTCLDTSDIEDTEDTADIWGRHLGRRTHAVTRGRLHPCALRGSLLVI